jgi:hypothetical protein
LFKVTIAIVTCFDLKIKQFNMVNAFVNVKRDLYSVLVAYKLLDRFKQLRMCVKIDRALYKIRDSLAL